MECVCGCGREISRDLTQRNFTAASVALELLAWDKNRASPGPGPEGREGLIARGADCYGRLLYTLHGEGGGDPDDDCAAWLKESAAMRDGESDMNRWQLIGQGSPRLSKSDMACLDRKHPELSFTGSTATAGPEPDAPSSTEPDPAPPAAADPPGDDLVERLERLRTLHAEGALTDDEFAAAKARLLERG